MENCINMENVKTIKFFSETDNNAISYINDYVKPTPFYCMIDLININTEQSLNIFNKIFPELEIKYIDSQNNDIAVLKFKNVVFNTMLNKLRENQKLNVITDNYTITIRNLSDESCQECINNK